MGMVHSSAAINTVVRNSSLDAVAESREVHNSPDSIDISEGANVAGSLYQPASQTAPRQTLRQTTPLASPMRLSSNSLACFVVRLLRYATSCTLDSRAFGGAHADVA